MSAIDFSHLSNLIPASLSPESAEELATALSTGRWWAIMEVLHPIDEERQFDFASVSLSQTVEDDREFSASGPADASSVPEASDELATALAAGAIMEVVASRGQNQIPEPQPENEPERPQQRYLIMNGRVRGVLRGLQSARPLRRMREPQDEAFADHMPPQNEQHVEVVASRGQNQIPEPQPEDEPERPQLRELIMNRRVSRIRDALQSLRRRMREPDDGILLVHRLPRFAGRW